MPPILNGRSAPNGAIRLVVNADDFGIDESVNRGIVQAHREGIVTAASLMAVGRAYDHAVALSRQTPALDLGVHLTLVAESPLLGHSSLTVENGRFPADAGALLRRLLGGKIRMEDIRREWAAQIERILDHGIRPTHLDSHQHVHALPGISHVALELARRYRIPFVRIPMEIRPASQPLTVHRVFRRIGAAVLTASCIMGGLHPYQPKSAPPVRFLGFQEGGRLNVLRLACMIRELQPGVSYELMCHPGYAPQDPDVTRWRYRHLQELHTLCDRSIRDDIAARRIQLCRFADLIPP